MFKQLKRQRKENKEMSEIRKLHDKRSQQIENLIHHVKTSVESLTHRTGHVGKRIRAQRQGIGPLSKIQ